MPTFKTARKYGAKIAAAGSALMLSGAAMAQSATGIDAVLDAVSLTGIEATLLASALTIVGIALVMKGPDLAKRIIRKV